MEQFYEAITGADRRPARDPKRSRNDKDASRMH
jgi:hypothetical protein